jgi:predicted transposase YdaD
MRAASLAWAGYKRAMDHDHSYKLLFAHPKMMRDLLEAFVAGQWVFDADFSTLERVNGSYITDDLRSRADDIIWRVRCGDHMVYLLLEFQSSPDKFMAVRVLTYVGLLYQDLIRASNGRDLDELPAILPIVLHSGERTWSAAEDVASLVSNTPRELDLHRPRLRYLLIDESRYEDADLAARHNFAAMLFRLEGCRCPERMWTLVTTLEEWLLEPELESLRRAFAVWLEKVILKRLADEKVFTNSLWERSAMLAERVIQWEKDFMEKGRQQGQLESLRRLLTRLLEKRFGELPVQICTRLREASLDELESWTECLLDAASLEEVISCVQPIRADS